jgi:hypothetical protein
MNNLLVELSNISKSIKNNGWITIPPIIDENLEIRVEWYLDQKHGYCEYFDLRKNNLSPTGCDLTLKGFAHRANQCISEIIKNSENKAKS